MLKIVTAARYVTPLREGGSLPAILETDDGDLYVTKFVGAGQGPKALIAELVAGEIGRALGLPVPEIAFVQLDPTLGRSEPDSEIQDLLFASAGLNLGLRYIPNAFAFNLLLTPPPVAALASRIVWFDAYVTNVDRTPRNVNLLMQDDQMWLIDHGAALYFHHDWGDVAAGEYVSRSRTPFPLIKDHTLLSFADDLPTADADLRRKLDVDVLTNIIAQIPDAWLNGETGFADSADHRRAYVNYLLNRLDASSIFIEEATRARANLV